MAMVTKMPPKICFTKCCPELIKSSKKKILEYFESLIFAMASLNPKSKLSQTKIYSKKHRTY